MLHAAAPDLNDIYGASKNTSKHIDKDRPPDRHVIEAVHVRPRPSHCGIETFPCCACATTWRLFCLNGGIVHMHAAAQRNWHQRVQGTMLHMAPSSVGASDKYSNTC